MFVVPKQNRYYNIIVYFQIQAISMNTNRTLKELCLLGGLTYSAFGMAQERPNIIVFLVDDMGLMDTSVPFITDAQGKPVKQPLNEWYHTPNMERLASQGICFSTFYAQSVSFSLQSFTYDRTKCHSAWSDQLDQCRKQQQRDVRTSSLELGRTERGYADSAQSAPTKWL